MGFKRPEVQIFSPRPGRRGRLSVRGDFFSPHSSKIPALTPAVRSSLSAQCPLRSFTLPLRTSARPRSLTTFRGRAPRDIARETEERPRRFFLRFAHQNPHPDARRPLLPFRAMSASLLHFTVTNIRPSPLVYHIPRTRSARYCPRDGRASAAIFCSLRSPKSPPGRPAVRSSPSAYCPLRSLTLPLRTSARPRSLTTFRGRAPRDIARETVERPRRFFIRFAHQNPRRGVPPSAPPFPRNVRFAPSTLPLRTSARPRSLTTFRGRACMKSEALPSI